MKTSVTLADLISPHWRPIWSLSLASPEQEAAITGKLCGDPHDVIDDWRLIALTVEGSSSLRLLGRSRGDGGNFASSHITGLSTASGLAATLSGGLYGLGTRGTGEPPLAHLRHVVKAMRHWGLTAVLNTEVTV